MTDLPPLPSSEAPLEPSSNRPLGPPPWSAAAIAGFVCSLLGCLGITAVAGLVLGVVGLKKTSGGRRRGRGFAVAAIPLSLISGIAAFLLGLAIVVGGQLNDMPDRIEAVLKLASGKPTEAADLFRQMGSSDFNEAVSSEALGQWLKKIIAEHGTPVKVLIEPNQLGIGEGPDDKLTQSMTGKFVNDKVDLVITFSKHSGFGRLKIDDILIGGSSPRDAGD